MGIQQSRQLWTKSVVNEKKRKKRKDQKEVDQEKEVEVRNDPEVENEAKAENDPEETEVHPDQRNRNDPDDLDHVTRSVPDPVIENAIHAIKKKMVPMLKSKLLTVKSKLKHRLKI